MLTIKNHDPLIDTDNRIISIWNLKENAYEIHSFEFIEDLYGLIQTALNDVDDRKIK